MRHLPGQHVLVALGARAGLVVHLPVPAEARLLRGLLGDAVPSDAWAMN